MTLLSNPDNLLKTASHSLRLARTALPVLAALLLSACPNPAPESRAAAGPAPVAIVTQTVKAGPLDRSWTAVGSLMANESLMIRPEVAGRISRIGVQEGQAVAAGAVLFELDSSVDRALVQQAQANLALTRRDKKRADELFAGELIAPSERDAATAALDGSEAALALARARLDKAQIRSPFAGRAGLRQVALGDYVSAGQDLVRIEDVARMKVEFRLPELALPDLRVDQTVELELDAFPGKPVAAKVYALDSRVADDTRSIAARAVLDNLDGRLRAGQFARVRLIVEHKPDALMIPEQTLIPRGDRQFVFVVQDGRASERQVQVGQRHEGAVEILSGLTAGEQIVTSGLQKISNGAAVKVATASAAP